MLTMTDNQALQSPSLCPQNFTHPLLHGPTPDHPAWDSPALDRQSSDPQMPGDQSPDYPHQPIQRNLIPGDQTDSQMGFPSGDQSPDDQALDHQAICRQLVGETFAWDMARSLELALLRTFCVPRIAALLRETGEFIHRSQKRYDDTGLILGSLLKWGYDSPQGKQAIARMNAIHRHHAIANEDFLYVLSTSVVEPLRWNQRYGWRPFTPVETEALFQFWRAVGDRMGIVAIPPTLAALIQFKQDYEQRYFIYTPDNAAVGAGVIRLMQQWLPAILRPWVRPVVAALVDAPMGRALGWPSPSQGLTAALDGYFHLRRWLWQRGLWRSRSGFFVDRPNRTYPHGYTIATLGPDQPPQTSTSRCPFLRMRAFLRP